MRWNKFRGPSRRAFLGGGAAAITLPFLESLRVPAMASPTGGACPVRLIWVYTPCGMVMEEWTPLATGANYDLRRVLAPLASNQSQVSVLSGLANMPASVPVAGDHARGTGSFLSCTTVEHTSGDDISNGISIDQVVANAIGDQTAFRSLELGTTGGASAGDCDSGYSCAYSRNISWASETLPMAKLTDPGLVFDRLFAGFDATLSEADRERRTRWRTSVLDTVTGEANSMAGKLSTSDTIKLDEYLTGIRDLEVRIAAGLDGTCLVPDDPGTGLDYETTLNVMQELMVKALECDLTRVITFMYENAGSYRSFDFIGVTGGHHELSHHQGVTATIENLVTIDTWQMVQFNNLLTAMAAVTEADGSTLLDNSLVCLSSEIADGDRHNHNDLPVLLAGGGGGQHTVGEHRLHTDVPVANLYLAMAAAAGVSVATHGDSSGVLSLL
jgi:hypothetical protein